MNKEIKDKLRLILDEAEVSAIGDTQSENSKEVLNACEDIRNLLESTRFGIYMKIKKKEKR